VETSSTACTIRGSRSNTTLTNNKCAAKEEGPGSSPPGYNQQQAPRATIQQQRHLAVATASQPKPIKQPPPGAAAAAEGRVPFEAAGVQVVGYITPLPWIPTLQFPVMQPHPASASSSSTSRTAAVAVVHPSAAGDAAVALQEAGSPSSGSSPSQSTDSATSRRTKRCVVCMDARSCVLLRPCGHQVLCEGCWTAVSGRAAAPECPYCRGEVHSTEVLTL
jgi:hypothetical protein